MHLTRVITSTQLLSSLLWIQGPPWLTSMCNWPTWSPSSVLHISTTEPIATDNPTAISGVHLVIDINRHGRLTKLLRVTAYVLRFINNAKMPSQKTSGSLTATELLNTQRSWMKAAQQEVFLCSSACYSAVCPTKPDSLDMPLNNIHIRPSKLRSLL